MVNKKEYMRKWHKDNPEYGKQWQKNNPGYMKEWYIANRERILKYKKEYRKNNCEQIAKRRKIKRETDLKYNINNRMRAIIGKSLKGNKKGRHWEKLVGYNLKDLIKRLQKTIPKGFTWNNFLGGDLHIDHIIPISAFNFDSPKQIDFKRCWALKNLRLLPAKENRVKYNKLNKPFQPALKI